MLSLAVCAAGLLRILVERLGGQFGAFQSDISDRQKSEGNPCEQQYSFVGTGCVRHHV